MRMRKNKKRKPEFKHGLLPTSICIINIAACVLCGKAGVPRTQATGSAFSLPGHSTKGPTMVFLHSERPLCSQYDHRSLWE